MIEASGFPEPAPAPPPDPAPQDDPICLEDLAAVVRVPVILAKVERVLRSTLESFPIPEDFPFQAASPDPSGGRLDFGLRWEDGRRLLGLFAGMTWGEAGHDPLWEVRVEALKGLDPEKLRAGGLLRRAARRAEGRFTEWDRFWHEDKVDASLLIGASAACTRFLEEENPDAFAAEYLAGALHALHASGALAALLEAAREAAA